MSTMISEQQFWKAIAVLFKNFSAVDKSTSCLKVLNLWVAIEDLPQLFLLEDYSKVLDAITQRDFIHLNKVNIVDEITNKDRQYHNLLISARIVKKRSINTTQVLIYLDFLKRKFSFINYGKGVSFIIQFKANQIKVEPLYGSNEKAIGWCNFVLEKKLLKWAINDFSNSGKITSLNLIDSEDYITLYQKLKEKYGETLIQIWPECTDSTKYVYEDIAIATYLILLWKRTRKPKCFVDLGCGNGLLVFILNSEGINGYGIDIRRRKIWDVYPSFVSLNEEVIVPSDLPSYHNVDWILGNHSDELSPWIPILTMLNSYDTNFFLLPCCAFELNGEKYQRRNSKISIYNDFLHYIENISTKCGFIIEVDRLKIPSTKRIAYIGFKRNYITSDFDKEKNCVMNLINSEMKGKNIKLREKKELVRNCTQIENSILEQIVLKIFEYLFIADKDEQEYNCTWRRGRVATIKDIVNYFSSNELKSIKSECGGLRTLLKNKHEIFEISGDKVTLRYPRKRSEYCNACTVKKRACFFHNNHPDGCPLMEEDCTFVHEKINKAQN